jgi:hypothetical protein
VSCCLTEHLDVPLRDRDRVLLAGGDWPGSPEGGADRLVVPLRYRHGDEVLSFFSTTTVFGTPLDVTLAELAIESFFPADPSTAARLHG